MHSKQQYCGTEGITCNRPKIHVLPPPSNGISKNNPLFNLLVSLFASVTKVMELVNHKARTMLPCPLYSPAHLDIRSGNRGFSP